MRQIGTLPKNLDAGILTDYLLSQGIKTRVIEAPEGWHLWVFDEDQVQNARQELESFLSAPDLPRYHEGAKVAQVVRIKEKAIEKQFRKNDRSVADLWAQPGFRRRPLTALMIAISVVVFLAQHSGSGVAVERGLSIVDYDTGRPGPSDDGFNPLRRGELWRLVTPIFMHISPLHIFFNMWWLFDLGTMIEFRRGTWRMLILVLVSAMVSNLGEVLWQAKTNHGFMFGLEGMSGVVYSLFGYVWMKMLYEPEEGLLIHPNSVAIMLGWLVLCMTGAVGPVANAAHFIGMAVGILFGVLRF